MPRAKTVPTEVKERAVLVQVVLPRTSTADADDSLTELARLADTAGAQVVAQTAQHRKKPTAALYVGKGKLVEVAALCREHDANLVIFDNDLGPSQMRNLDFGLGLKVIDRTELILQIFARRARTHEAQLQVELAQLEYLRPRLRTDVRRPLARQRGGIGLRGPGETPLERRSSRVRQRINHLRKHLEEVSDARARTRQRRAELPSLVLVGYTNSGKSTLLNALTDARVHVDDRLFATLDATARAIRLKQGRKAVLSDTVGFIRNLPHHLVASFRSTLAAAREADLLIQVADTPHPHLREHLAVVSEALNEIGAADVPRLIAFNKVDEVDDSALLDELSELGPQATFISALQGLGLDTLLARVSQMLRKPRNRAPANGN